MIQTHAQTLFERDFEIVKELYSRFPSIRVKVLDPDRASELTDKPYIITELCQDGVERILMRVDRLDSNLINYLYSIDQEFNDIELAVEKAIQKATKEREAKEAEEANQAQDLVAVGVKHFNKGKLAFRYKDEHGDKKVIK